MKRKIRSLTVLLALVMCFGAFSVTALYMEVSFS